MIGALTSDRPIMTIADENPGLAFVKGGLFVASGIEMPKLLKFGPQYRWLVPSLLLVFALPAT